MYSNKEQRLRQALIAAAAEYEAAKTKAAQNQRELRRLQKQKQAIEHHPDWHKYALGAERYVQGYLGHMAPACAYLWSLPFGEYRDAIGLVVPLENDTIARIELEAIKDNLADWTSRGEAIILRREADRYWADHDAFGKWQSDHPDHENWRKLPITGRQSWLMERTADALDIDAPPKLSRGHAHDWLRDQGANLRFQGRDFKNSRQIARGVSSADLFDLSEAEDD